MQSWCASTVRKRSAQGLLVQAYAACRWHCEACVLAELDEAEDRGQPGAAG
jgi:hypothetical protein